MAHEKYEKLNSLLAGYGRAIIAYSGGVDSAFLLKAAVNVLGREVLAVTADSASLPRAELAAARALAAGMGARHLVIDTQELDNPQYAANPANRCYFCKAELYTHLGRVAREQGIPYILNGINRDDQGDFRPGMQAAKEFQVLSPLLAADLGKAEIRELARELGLSAWDKPAAACLSSRIPYGEPVTPEKLRMIEQAEDFLHSLGLRQLRVRHHEGKLARLEVEPEELLELAKPEMRERIVSALREIGYLHVTLDLRGYRMGSLNEALQASAHSA